MLSSLLFRKKRDTTTTMMRSPAITTEPLGLKTIAVGSLDNPRAPICVKRSFVASPSPSSSSDASSSNKPEDEVAEEEEEEEEEEVDVEINEEEDERDACWATYGKRSHCLRRFPPPMPLLARTANLSCHMPWVLKRTYKEDGSLVLQEVRVKHHEYFRACRKNGRLTLQLVELDDDSPLFVSWPKREEGIDRVTESDEECQPSPSLQSSMLSSPPSSCLPEREDCTKGKARSPSIMEAKLQKIKDVIRVREVDVPRVQPRFEMPSMMMLSPSMPEPVHA
ncbi:hypothetical protein COCNU_05G006450 [Cocos nucifera]|uniref:FAF domain-containing protein n=1 Tax=Cocos nucifera TaxID=13894 RepID=A0A8K0N253_COCNU|nr:hypothetical protein COCNU_05G006450 [Cocos nucifera]